jgi:hypothetical protein
MRGAERGRCDHWHRWRQDLQVLAMCAGCRELWLEPVITYYHFTTTRWVAVNGFEPPHHSWNSSYRLTRRDRPRCHDVMAVQSIMRKTLLGITWRGNWRPSIRR